MKKLLLSSVLALGLYAPAFTITPAHAVGCGVNFTPTIGVNCANVRVATYSAAILKLVPAATPTDFFCISGSATKTIHVRRIELGAVGTGLNQPIYLNHNLGLDTGTAAVAATYGPIAYPMNSANPAATATVVAYNYHRRQSDHRRHGHHHPLEHHPLCSCNHACDQPNLEVELWHLDRRL